MIELLTYYVIAGALIIGAPAVFFIVAFMPALMNTKGAVVGYKTPNISSNVRMKFVGFVWYRTNICMVPYERYSYDKH